MGMAAILINGPWLFVQIFNPPSKEGSTWSLKKIGPGVSEEVVQSVDEGWTTDRRMNHEGQQVITIAHPEPSAQMS